jgi:aspartate aminotransferase-like enzyme
LQKLDIDTFIINAHETTIGRLYDLKKVGNFCRKNKLLNIVDAISTFVCDTIDMKTQSIDALILSSNKGLALPPGLGMVILTPNAIKRLKKHTSVYFDFKNYIQNMKRGQTPFTPTISIINQLHFRLKQLDKYGIKKEVKKKKKLANYFRKKITKLPLKFYVDTMPNGMTTLTPTDGQLAYKIIEDFKQQYNIVLTPSGGALANKLIRVSHMGEMNKKYLDILINSLYRYYKIDR